MDAKERFKRKAERVADFTDIEVTCYDDPRDDDEHEDDGYLHVTRAGLRAVFDVGVGQSRDGREQNINTRAVLAALKIKPKHPERVFMKEEEDEPERCHECGRDF